MTQNNFFIVIEGIDFTGKSTLTKNLCSHLNALYLKSPPEIACPLLYEGTDMRPYFDSIENSTNRRTYYSFTNLILSEIIKNKRKEQPVICDRYWYSTLAYSSIDEGRPSSYAELFEKESLYEIPDLMILLTVSEEARIERIKARGIETFEENNIRKDQSKRDLILERYRLFNPIEIDTSNMNQNQVLEEAIEILREKGIIV